MAILQQCSRCHKRISLKNKKCSCGATFTALKRVLFIELRDLTGKRLIRSLGNVGVEFARNAELKLKRDICEGNLEEKKISWKDIRTSFIRMLEASHKSNAYIQDSYRFLSEMGQFWGDALPYDKLTTQHCIEFRMSIVRRGLAPATQDRYFASARSAWNFSVKDRPNPFAQVGLLNVPNELTRYLTDEQRIRLMDAAKTVSMTLYQVIVVALSTGLRKGNILRLRRSEVNFDSGVISLLTKGNKQHHISPASAVMDMLKDIPDNGTDYFWINPDTNEPFHIDWRKPWIKAKTLAGIPKEFRFHDLRHDAGTKLYQSTGDIKLVAQVLGHSTLKVSERYAHILRPHLQKGFDILNPLSTYTSHSHENNNKNR